jgi:putative FmdB family regulatory protein
MPILQYKCPKCGKEFEELVKKFDVDVICPDCGEKAQRSYSGTMYSSTGKQPKKCSGHCQTCDGCK